MDANRFDTLTRYLGAAAADRPATARRPGRVMSRRRGLAGMVAALAGLVGLAGAGPVTAQPGAAAKLCLRNGTRCHAHSGAPGDPCRRCCSGYAKERPGGKGQRCACVPPGKRCNQTGQCCRDLRCRQGRCVTPVEPTCGTGGPCTIFVTSQRYPGDFGGLLQADHICQTLAEATGSLAPAGTYQAWLSDTTTSAGARLVHSSGPYVLVDGTEVAANWDALTNTGNQALQNPINRSETGQLVQDLVWTNTNSDGSQIGTQPTDTCFDWTSITPNPNEAVGRGGLSTSQNAGWTNTGGYTCVSSNYFYCLQQA